jgi:hypothetical protein
MYRVNDISQCKQVDELHDTISSLQVGEYKELTAYRNKYIQLCIYRTRIECVSILISTLADRSLFAMFLFHHVMYKCSYSFLCLSFLNKLRLNES